MTGRALLLLALALLAVPDARADGPAAQGRAVEIRAQPVEVPAADLHRTVSQAGAWVLRAADGAFGGFSALEVRGDRLLAASDRGHWLTARLVEDDRDLTLAEGRLAPMLGADGGSLAAADAEALARAGEDLVVAFERDHRLMRHAGGGALELLARPEGFAALPGNAGIEALAALPDGALLAIGEGRGPQGFPVFRIAPDGVVTRAHLPSRSRHDVTGAALGPQGRLYVVFRHYSPATGVSIRLRRYHLDAAGLPRPDRVTELASFESASGVDNMGAVALSPGPGGGTRLWLLSDDNFNAVQRTLLMRFDIAP